MSQNIVLIPAWRREDFLSVTLDYIRAANGAEKNHYVFLIDRGFHTSVVDVAKSLPFEKTLHFSPQHRYHGNSFNVLEGYKLGLRLAEEKGGELVYLIEEDIWIGKDFFDFHEKVQSKYDAFCVSAVKNQNDATVFPAEPESVYRHFAFQSLGISFKRQPLSTVTRHAGPEFYRSMLRYVKTHFKHSRYGNQWCEQDGLINRIVEQDPRQVIYPYVARAYHAGFVGYNRKGRAIEGTFEQRVASLKSMTDEQMNERADEYKDIRRAHMDGYGVSDYVLK